MSDDRQYAPATLRNRDVILDVLRGVLPMKGVILEIASGSGEHIVHFARSFPSLVFQPSDPDPDARLSVAAWATAAGVTNVRAPIALDASSPVWPIASADGIICINMVHISPWEATLGLINGAAAAPISGVAALPLRSIPTRRDRYRSEQPSLRPKSSRSQSELGSARTRSGRRDGAIRWILGSGYHRNARKQFERGVPSNVIVSVAGDPRPPVSFSRSPDTCGWPRGSQLRVPFPSHRPDVADRRVLVHADALRACRLSDAATANLSSSRRIARGSKCVSSSRV